MIYGIKNPHDLEVEVKGDYLLIKEEKRGMLMSELAWIDLWDRTFPEGTTCTGVRWNE